MALPALNVPTTGPILPTDWAGLLNLALTAILQDNPSDTPPNNFPSTGSGAAKYQHWMDTSPGTVGGAVVVDRKTNDGSTWLNWGAEDQTNHIPLPKVGGGSASLSGASGTPDIGSIRQTYILLTSTSSSTPITSFGSNALLNVGESKFVRCAAAGIITYNATSMIVPGAADLPFNIGDTFHLIYLGTANWLLYDFKRATTLGKPTGEVFSMYGTGALSGAVRANGLTIGNAASNGTERANADTINLFIWLYIQDANLAIFTSGGAGSTRTAPGNTRAAAITDYNLNKALALPDFRSRFEMGAGTMGATASHRTAGALFSSGSADVLGSVGGEGAHVQGTKEIAAHAHDVVYNSSKRIWSPDGGAAQSAGGAGTAMNIVANLKAGSATAVTATAATDLIAFAGHGFAAETPVQLDFEVGGSIAGGLAVGTTYYVVANDANSFKLSATPGGSAIDITSAGSLLVLWAASNNLPPFVVVTKYLAL